MRVFLDANILFSASRTAGAIRQLVELVLERGHACYADEHVIVEAHRNLLAKQPDALSEFWALLRRVNVAAVPSTTAPLPAAVALPENDRAVLAAAIALRCDVLLTGDRTHFGQLYGHAISGVTMYSPRHLAEKLVSDAAGL